MAHQLNAVNEESLKIGLTIHRRKGKFRTNSDKTDNTQIDGTELKR